MRKKAIVLLSGGLDSATCLAIALSQGYEVFALSFLYGQKGAAEVDAAQKISKSLGAHHFDVVEIGLDKIGGSSLTTAKPIPTEAPVPDSIPSTYVPARNTIFLSYALAYAEVSGARDIFIGANSLDYSGYPDCRPEYFEAYEQMANLATRTGVSGERITIQRPLQHLSKAQIIKKGFQLGVDFAQTISCYQPDRYGAACGPCESCRIRLRGFKQAGLADPAIYANLPDDL